ncbi:hypothetical protein PV328_004495 [Microctonus aethiopoides]|uniref:ATPase AAA-type core domain-containing protein n=1 Tax=Microctonus aethiopoides TaxID=144406 RepID=A0AA39FAX2_9HYME|nr:hypothetical protein PV328_004495 [Microctonus aethiopoides]
MSNYFYNKLWKTTYNDVEKLHTLDNAIQTNVISKPKEIVLTQILPIYLRYRNIIQRLIQCYDQIIPSQKRQFIKRLLDCSIARMLEYKREIVKLNCSEYEWFDDFLIKMKWTPDNIAISPPSSYTTARQKELEQRHQLIDSLIEKSELAKESENNLINEKSSTSTVELNPTSSSQAPSASPNNLSDDIINETDEQLLYNAILIIQSHERTRIGRANAIQIERDNLHNIKLKAGEIELKKVNTEEMEKAAETIQRYWRGYAARKRIEKYFNRVEEVLGMKISSVKNKSAMEKDQENFRKRQELQEQALIQIEDTINRERIKIFEKKSPTLKEDIIDEIHEWFNLWYDALGHFGIFPTVKAGGTILVATGQSLTPEEYFAKKNEPKEKKKKKKKEKKKKNLKKKNKDNNWIMPESKILQNVDEIKREFNDNWSLNNDPAHLNDQDDIKLIQNEIYYELQLKVREIVDELMRLELEQLNSALRKDHKHDKPKFKFPGMKKKEIDEMFNELVLARIIKNYPSVKLDQWMGDVSYQNFEAKKNFKPYQHRLGEIKQTIIDYCILPLGNKQVHSLAPLVKSICIVGLPCTGKSFLINAICNEIGALLFDLTPNNLIGKYEDKAGRKFLMKMINILARHYPPAIIMIDGGDKPWWRKLPPAERSMQPRKLAKLLPKLIKSIKRGDQILVLGLASEPWKSKKRFYKIYNKFIILPSTDYNTLYLYYQNIIMNYHGIDRNFDISSLTKATIGYPIDIIREAIENVLTIQRRIKLKFQPLLPEEILTELIKWTSPKDKVTRQLELFENKTPLGKKKLKISKRNNDKISTKR